MFDDLDIDPMSAVFSIVAAILSLIVLKYYQGVTLFIKILTPILTAIVTYIVLRVMDN